MYCIINAQIESLCSFTANLKDVESDPQRALQNTIYTNHIQSRKLILIDTKITASSNYKCILYLYICVLYPDISIHYHTGIQCIFVFVLRRASKVSVYSVFHSVEQQSQSQTDLLNYCQSEESTRRSKHQRFVHRKLLSL